MDEVVMRSEKSDACLFHLIHCHIWVEWKMKVVYKDEHSCKFTYKVFTDYPNKVLAIAAKLSAVNYFLQKHISEEGENFSKNIVLKFRKN